MDKRKKHYLANFMNPKNYHPDMELYGSGDIDIGHKLAERESKFFYNKEDNFSLEEIVDLGKCNNINWKELIALINFESYKAKISRENYSKWIPELVNKLKEKGYPILENNFLNYSFPKFMQFYDLIKNHIEENYEKSIPRRFS